MDGNSATAGPSDPSKAPAGRQVEIMNYSERFATAKKWGGGVGR